MAMVVSMAKSVMVMSKAVNARIIIVIAKAVGGIRVVIIPPLRVALGFAAVQLPMAVVPATFCDCLDVAQAVVGSGPHSSG